MIKKGELYYPDKNFQKKALINNRAIYKKASANPVKFWEGLAKEIFWQKKWKKAFEHKPPYFKWFVGGKINITESALDKNLEEKKNKVALIWEPEAVGERQRIFSYYDLFREVNRLANALKKMGAQKGDRIGIYSPMIPEVIISMLACARIGAVHAVVFSAFSPKALQVRLQDTEAKILITADGYFRRGKVVNLKQGADEGIKETKVEKIVVVKRAGNEIFFQPDRDFWYQDLIKNESDWCPAEAMDSEDPLFILYTSGSTGKPKGCVHSCGGYGVQAKFTAKWIFDLKEDDIFWSTADVGWITGHTYSCYGPLLNGATFVIFEGAPDYPDPGRWCEIIDKYGITTFYTAPTAIRMFEKYGVEYPRKYKLDSLQILGSVGEPIDKAAWQWYFKEVGREKCPLVDTWWQTETGGILITSLPGIGPFKPTFAGIHFPGVNFAILNEKGKSCKIGEQGNLVILPPFAPGLLRGIYKNPEKYLETYWSECGNKIYFTSDGACKDKNGLIRIVGRIDDVIKVAGHRIATGELESAIALHSDITECAVVGVADEIKGEVPVAFVVCKTDKYAENIKEEVVRQIRKEIGPIATPKEVYLVKDLPKTRSGKIMRRILRKLFTSEELGDLSALSNPESVEEIKLILR
ncbi:MAG: Acetyl-coenzyme A synthetase [Parcubacteria group bacterium GW2011_GWC2_39_11]|nr:MAG: Acetyl-coenzyme A synthetase [Parcubacteria group bacterium GW2011_GWA2_38_27]KKQ97816.1 MAG: Acetyl-coenzyme A synthetase [Parcubacteria group bacterium GW2011_GWC2_39_11]